MWLIGIHPDSCGGGYVQSAEACYDLERGSTVNLSLSSVVGQILGGGPAG